MNRKFIKSIYKKNNTTEAKPISVLATSSNGVANEKLKRELEDSLDRKKIIYIYNKKTNYFFAYKRASLLKV